MGAYSRQLDGFNVPVDWFTVRSVFMGRKLASAFKFKAGLDPGSFRRLLVGADRLLAKREEILEAGQAAGFLEPWILAPERPGHRLFLKSLLQALQKCAELLMEPMDLELKQLVRIDSLFLALPHQYLPHAL